MGKNFSGNNLGQRKASDFYETPYSMTQQLLDAELFTDPILEPACGNGAIVDVLRGAGCEKVVGYDIETNFLDEERAFPTIITNPPFSLSMDFILKAKRVATEKFAFLLPLSYLHGQRRYEDVWRDVRFPLARVHVFTRYPMLGEPLRSDGKYATGMMAYAWYVWEKGWNSQPLIQWINNDSYVLRKEDR